MNIFIKSILVAWISAYLLLNCVETARAADQSLDPFHITILGLVIGGCASQDIYSKLGPGIPFKNTTTVDVRQVCYVSHKDDTLILFSFENSKCSRFRLLSQKMKFYKWHFCEKSPLVSKHLATASGIKLGISKNKLKTILGAPQSESDAYLKFVFEQKQKASRTEIEKTAPHSKDGRKNPCRTAKTIIRAEFSDTGLISFDVSNSLQ